MLTWHKFIQSFEILLPLSNILYDYHVRSFLTTTTRLGFLCKRYCGYGNHSLTANIVNREYYNRPEVRSLRNNSWLAIYLLNIPSQRMSRTTTPAVSPRTVLKLDTTPIRPIFLDSTQATSKINDREWHYHSQLPVADAISPSHDIGSGCDFYEAYTTVITATQASNSASALEITGKYTHLLNFVLITSHSTVLLRLSTFVQCANVAHLSSNFDIGFKS